MTEAVDFTIPDHWAGNQDFANLTAYIENLNSRPVDNTQGTQYFLSICDTKELQTLFLKACEQNYRDEEVKFKLLLKSFYDEYQNLSDRIKKAKENGPFEDSTHNDLSLFLIEGADLLQIASMRFKDISCLKPDISIPSNLFTLQHTDSSKNAVIALFQKIQNGESYTTYVAAIGGERIRLEAEWSMFMDKVTTSFITKLNLNETPAMLRRQFRGSAPKP